MNRSQARMPKSARVVAKSARRPLQVRLARKSVRPRAVKLSTRTPVRKSAAASAAPVVRPAAPAPLPQAELSSPLSMYMRDAGQVPLLTAQEEIQLAKRIRRGDAAAREHMIRANLRFVIKIAREYEHLGLPLLDLINEGNIGLMIAVDRFDPRKGAKLSTYSSWWIRQSIRRALATQGKTIRLPVYAADQVYHMSRAELRLREQLGRDATERELADELGLSSDRIGELRVASLRPASLDAPLGDDDSSRLSEVIADENAHLPGEDLDRESQLDLMRAQLPKLPAREAHILRLRFGLDGGPERTLEDIGAMMNLTRERIRQLQNLALSRLRTLMTEQESFAMTA